jgi:hypothetical protein
MKRWVRNRAESLPVRGECLHGAVGMVNASLAPPRRADEWTGSVMAAAVAAGFALVAIAAGWRGADLPAQLFHVELFRQHGFVLWNSQWFSGVPALDYSVLSPALGALTGPVALGAVSGTVSAFLFDRLVRFQFGAGARVGSLWFALSMVTNLLVGRITFALGVVFALAALLALQRGHGNIAIFCALLCGLACPDAGLFLAIASGAVALARPRAKAAWLTCAMAVAPVLVIAAVFPSPGAEPYEWWALGCDLAICALLLLVVPRRLPALRFGAGLYVLVPVAAKVMSSPLGGIVSRLNQYAAGPLLACILWERRRALVVVLAVPLLFWQWFPTFDTIAFARSDASTHSSFYQPLLAYFARNPPGFGRVEIPSTYRHWETAYVAPRLALARGWERDLDYAYDAAFYNGSLTAGTYGTWLTENGVKYVALPATRLDSSSVAEAKLLNGNLPYLQPVWHDAHWRVWRFAGYRGLVAGPARLESLTADSFELDVQRAGTVTVRIHDSPHWAVDGGNACTVASPGGWLEIKRLVPGDVRVSQALRGTRCDVDK